MLIIILACISVAVAAPDSANSGQKRYDNYRLVSVLPTNEEQKKSLETLETDGQDSEFYDFWSHATLTHAAEIMVSPENYGRLTAYLRKHGMTPNVELENIQNFVDKSNPTSRSKSIPLPYNTIVNNFKYSSLEEISTYMDQMQSTYPNMVRKKTLTNKTYENRTMEYLEISTNNFAGTRHAIMLEGGIHAREWISPATLMYFVDRLLTTEGHDPEANYMLNTFDWYILPVMNPDGYSYTFSHDRMWRKNRVSHFSTLSCRGVDLNRNFNVRWGTVGVSTSCSSDIYCGPVVMSEVEAKNVKEIIDGIQGGDLKTRLIGYFAVHSYGQMILLPYGYGPDRPVNFYETDLYGNAAGAALKAVHQTDFTIGTGPEVLYAVAGASDDWALIRGSATFGYTYELRPKHAHQGGFALPPDQILPSGEELWASFYSMAQNFESHT